MRSLILKKSSRNIFNMKWNSKTSQLSLHVFHAQCIRRGVVADGETRGNAAWNGTVFQGRDSYPAHHIGGPLRADLVSHFTFDGTIVDDGPGENDGTFYSDIDNSFSADGTSGAFGF